MRDVSGAGDGQRLQSGSDTKEFGDNGPGVVKRTSMMSLGG